MRHKYSCTLSQPLGCVSQFIPFQLASHVVLMCVVDCSTWVRWLWQTPASVDIILVIHSCITSAWEFDRICGFCLSARFLRIHCKFSVGLSSVAFPGHGSRILMLLSPSHLVTTFLLTSLLLIFCPTAPHVCQSIGGSLSGGSGAPPTGHHVSAASTCPPEEVCNLKVHVIG